MVKKVYTKTFDDCIVIELDFAELLAMTGTEQATSRNKVSEDIKGVEVNPSIIDRTTDRGERLNQLDQVTIEKVDGQIIMRNLNLQSKTKKINLTPVEAKTILNA